MTVLSYNSNILLLDRDELNKNCRSNQKLKLEFLALFIDQANESILGLQTCPAKSIVFAQVIHKLKSNFRIIGFLHLYKFSQDLEQNYSLEAKNEASQAISLYIHLIKKAIVLVLEEINHIHTPQ